MKNETHKEYIKEKEYSISISSVTNKDNFARCLNEDEEFTLIINRNGQSLFYKTQNILQLLNNLDNEK